jgi:uncharacterized membrane protein (DUF485 family)
MTDWQAIERSDEFRELVSRKRSFVVPATIFFLAYYMAFILLAGYADFMGDSVYQGLTVGYCLALTQFVMVFVLGIWYLRKSENEFDPLAEAVVEAASEGGRFDRGAEDRTEVAR